MIQTRARVCVCDCDCVVRISNSCNIQNIPIIEGSLEVKLPTIWTVEKQR